MLSETFFIWQLFKIVISLWRDLKTFAGAQTWSLCEVLAYIFPYGWESMFINKLEQGLQYSMNMC
jgi:hypothetical protein